MMINEAYMKGDWKCFVREHTQMLKAAMFQVHIANRTPDVKNGYIRGYFPSHLKVR